MGCCEPQKSWPGAKIGLIFGIIWAAILIASLWQLSDHKTLFIFLFLIPFGAWTGYDSGPDTAVFCGTIITLMLLVMVSVPYWFPKIF